MSNLNYCTPHRSDLCRRYTLSERSLAWRLLLIQARRCTKLGTGFLVLFLLFVRPALAGAQNPPAAPSTSGTVQSSDVLMLFNDLDDIDHMRSINPLKLTAEQLDKIVVSLTTLQASYQKKLTSLAAVHVRKRADEIRGVKKSVLVGGEIPADFDKKMQQESISYAKSIAALELQNLQALSEAMRPTLTDAQVKAAVKLAKEAPVNAGKFGKGSDTQWFNMYLMQIVVGYPRIIPLFKEMRDALRTDTKSVASGSRQPSAKP